MSYLDMDTYCNFCGDEAEAIAQTRDGKTICEDCGRNLSFCEICGSLRKADETADEQIHYKEDCFK